MRSHKEYCGGCICPVERGSGSKNWKGGKNILSRFISHLSQSSPYFSHSNLTRDMYSGWSSPRGVFGLPWVEIQLPHWGLGSPECSEMKVCLCFQAKQLCSRFRPATARWSCGGHCPLGESVPGGNLRAHPRPWLPDWWVYYAPYLTGRSKQLPVTLGARESWHCLSWFQSLWFPGYMLKAQS